MSSPIDGHKEASLFVLAREYDGSAIFDASLYVGALFRKSCFG